MNHESAKLLWCAIQLGDVQNFSIETTDNIDSMRKFHNFIKSTMIENAVKETNGKTLLDIAVGRGGDHNVTLLQNDISEREDAEERVDSDSNSAQGLF